MNESEKSLEEILEDIKNMEDSSENTTDPNEDFSEYRMNPDKEKMFNPEENVVDYGVLMEQIFGEAPTGVTNSNTIKVSDDTKSKISNLLGDLEDDDDDWMND